MLIFTSELYIQDFVHFLVDLSIFMSAGLSQQRTQFTYLSEQGYQYTDVLS
jgi:hypothetical protein